MKFTILLAFACVAACGSDAGNSGETMASKVR